MGCGASIHGVDNDEDEDPGWVPDLPPLQPAKKKAAKTKTVTIAEPEVMEEPVETLTMEQIEQEADGAIAKARALMAGIQSPRPDDLELDDDILETLELDATTLEGATTSDATRLAEEAAKHAKRAGYHRAVADGDELPQQWREAGDDLESLPDAPAAAPTAAANETDKERKKREKKEAKEREKAEKKAAKEREKAEKAEAKRRKKEEKAGGGGGGGGDAAVAGEDAGAGGAAGENGAADDDKAAKKAAKKAARKAAKEAAKAGLVAEGGDGDDDGDQVMDFKG
jgi:hypothetical protein